MRIKKEIPQRESEKKNIKKKCIFHIFLSICQNVAFSNKLDLHKHALKFTGEWYEIQLFPLVLEFRNRTSKHLYIHSKVIKHCGFRQAHTDFLTG